MSEILNGWLQIFPFSCLSSFHVPRPQTSLLGWKHIFIAGRNYRRYSRLSSIWKFAQSKNLPSFQREDGYSLIKGNSSIIASCDIVAQMAEPNSMQVTEIGADARTSWRGPRTRPLNSRYRPGLRGYLRRCQVLFAQRLVHSWGTAGQPWLLSPGMWVLQSVSLCRLHSARYMQQHLLR